MLDIVAATGLVTRSARAAGGAARSFRGIRREPVDTLELTVDTADGRRSRPLPYVVFEAGARASLDGFDNVASIKTDVVHGAEIVALGVRSHRPLARVAASTPPGEPAADGRAGGGRAPRTRRTRTLAVRSRVSRTNAAGARRQPIAMLARHVGNGRARRGCRRRRVRSRL